MRIAVDTTGGDHAPEAIVEGALAAIREKKLPLTLLGEKELLELLLPNDATRELITLIDAPETIDSNDDPVMAIRRKKQSPLVIGCQLIRDGEIDALVTAGSTGAFMAAGMFVAGRLPGIERPALAPLFPTEDGRGVIVLDVGANMDAKPQHLLQYGLMGSLYAEKVLGRPNPSVALLNVGSEANKGNQAAREAHILLSQSSLNFVGNLEARDLLVGGIDVVVCDGFTGNVVLKFMEGMAASLFSMMRENFTHDLRSKAGALLLKPALRRFKTSLDYSEYGGAPLLGLNGVLVKCHGSSNPTAIKNGIFQAQKLIAQGVIPGITAAITNAKVE